MQNSTNSLIGKMSLKYLQSGLPQYIEVKFDGKRLTFKNNGDRSIDCVNYAMRGGKVIAFSWRDNGQPVEGYLYLGPWSERGPHYVVFYLRGRNPTAEVNLDRSFHKQLLRHPFTFFNRDHKNSSRKKEALALAAEAQMEIRGDRLVLGNWDAGGPEFTEGADEIFRRLVWAALAKDRLRRDENFSSSGRKSTRKSGTRSSGNAKHANSTHHAMGKLKPCSPNADQAYLAKTASSETYRSRSHATIRNELLEFVKKSGLQTQGKQSNRSCHSVKERNRGLRD